MIVERTLRGSAHAGRTRLNLATHSLAISARTRRNTQAGSSSLTRSRERRVFELLNIRLLPPAKTSPYSSRLCMSLDWYSKHFARTIATNLHADQMRAPGIFFASADSYSTHSSLLCDQSKSKDPTPDKVCTCAEERLYRSCDGQRSNQPLHRMVRVAFSTESLRREGVCVCACHRSWRGARAGSPG